VIIAGIWFYKAALSNEYKPSLIWAAVGVQVDFFINKIFHASKAFK